jgi:hypothetical protein
VFGFAEDAALDVDAAAAAGFFASSGFVGALMSAATLAAAPATRPAAAR